MHVVSDKEAPPASSEDSALNSITKFIEKDSAGRAHGIVNPHWMKKHNITVVGQFIKCMLESTELKDSAGWVGIKYKKTTYGYPCLYYHGMTDNSPGKLESNLEYMGLWVKSELVYMPIKQITYTDCFGKIDFVITLQGGKGDKKLSKVLEAAREGKIKIMVDPATLEALAAKAADTASKQSDIVEAAEKVVKSANTVVNGVATIREGVVPEEARKPEDAQTSV